MIEGFLIGVIVIASLTSGGLFLKFWRQTGDPLFLGFAAAFVIEGLNRASFLFIDPTIGDNAVVYSIRLLSYLMILGSIAYKNRKR